MRVPATGESNDTERVTGSGSPIRGDTKAAEEQLEGCRRVRDQVPSIVEELSERPVEWTPTGTPAVNEKNA